MTSQEEEDGEEVRAPSNPTTSREAQLTPRRLGGSLRCALRPFSSAQPVTANAAEDDRRGKQTLVRPSPRWQVK